MVARSLEEVIASLTPHQVETVQSLQSLACLPLRTAETGHGVLGLGWDAPRELADAEVEMLAAAAGQLAQALDRARLYEAERSARATSAAASPTWSTCPPPCSSPCCRASCRRSSR